MTISKSIFRSTGAALLLLNASGCGGRVDRGAEEARNSAPDPLELRESPTADAGMSVASSGGSGGAKGTSSTPVCRDLDQVCESDADCCSGTWCDNDTYAHWVCSAPLPYGSACTANGHCQSRTCRDYMCARPSCEEPGTVCEFDADCCAGSFCDFQTYGYGPQQCAPALPPGYSCTVDRGCQSRRCVDYQCAPG